MRDLYTLDRADTTWIGPVCASLHRRRGRRLAAATATTPAARARAAGSGTVAARMRGLAAAGRRLRTGGMRHVVAAPGRGCVCCLDAGVPMPSSPAAPATG